MIDPCVVPRSTGQVFQPDGASLKLGRFGLSRHQAMEPLATSTASRSFVIGSVVNDTSDVPIAMAPRRHCRDASIATRVVGDGVRVLPLFRSRRRSFVQFRTSLQLSQARDSKDAVMNAHSICAHVDRRDSRTLRLLFENVGDVRLKPEYSDLRRYSSDHARRREGETKMKRGVRRQHPCI